MKILILDLEISPILAAMWGIWNQNVNLSNITGESEILSWAAKWYGEDECHYSSLRIAGHTEAGKKRMLKEVHKLLDEADVVVTFNGDKFDLKILNQEFLLAGLTPPSPYKSIDLLKVMKRKFRWTSNKLSYILKRLGLGEKTPHEGIEMWLTCMNKGVEGYHKAWDTMEEYNVNDVFKTEELYDRVLPWIPNHPNRNLYTEGNGCPKCGSNHIQRRGTTTTKAMIYNRYQCMGCGDWLRSAKGTNPVPLSERLVLA